MSITLTCGANSQELDNVAGQTLGAVKSQLADILNIPTPVQSILGGQTVTDDYVLVEGDSIELIKPAGEKGSRGE